MRKRICLAMAIVVSLILLASGEAVFAQQKIVVGLSGCMSGAAAMWGQLVDRACSMAIDDLNAKGGIQVGGVKYMLDKKTYDHAFDPGKAVEIAKRMMSADKVSWIVTHGAAATKPIIPFTEENKTIVMAATAGTDIMVFQKQNYSYRITNVVPEVPLLFWLWAFKNHPEWKTTATAMPDDASGWEAVSDMKEKILPRGGVKMVADTFYKRGITDFYPILIKLLAAKPDVFDLLNMPPADMGRVLKQIREMGYKGPVVASILHTYGPVLEIAGSHAEGLIFAGGIDPNSRFATPEEKGFYEKWLKIYGPPFDLGAFSQAYGVYLVAQAMEKANSRDPEKVTKMLQTGEFTVLGRKLKMGGASAYGQPPRTVKLSEGIYVVEQGKPKMIDTNGLPADY
jgi:branched-chain amino acid transport system substrate-binding protein